MSITKQDIDSFVNKISYIVKSPFLTYWERREFVKGLKQSPYSELNNWHAEHCVGALYAKDRKKIEENNDIELIRYLSKLMLYTINGETDNSWLEDKYKEYHDKYDFSENKVFTSGAKKEELTYNHNPVWYPKRGFIEEILKQTAGYSKNKILFIHTVWRMASFIQNKKKDLVLYEELVKTLCLEIYNESYEVGIEETISEIKDTFQVDDMSFTYNFESWVDSILDKEALVDYLYLYPEIVEKELENVETSIDEYGIYSIEDLKQELLYSIDSILLAIRTTYKLFEETADSKKFFVKGTKREFMTKLTTHWVAGFIISNINKNPVKELLEMYEPEEDNISVILETCKAMNIHKHFYSEYKKVTGVSYTNRNKSSPPKGVKGSKADIVVIDEVTQTYKAEGKPPAEKVETAVAFDTESTKSGKITVINPPSSVKELINKIEESPIKPDVIYITKEGFTEMQEHPLFEVSSEVTKDPRKEAYIKGIYLGIVRELVKNTKELFASSFNNPSVIGIVNTALGDVVISAVLVEILPMINFGARKDFVDKVVELLKLNTSVAIGEFATNILIGIGKELAKDNKIQEIVKQVVTV